MTRFSAPRKAPQRRPALCLFRPKSADVSDKTLFCWKQQQQEQQQKKQKKQQEQQQQQP